MFQDRTFQIKVRYNSNSNPIQYNQIFFLGPQQRSPSYEDTLRKCQSLTKQSPPPLVFRPPNHHPNSTNKPSIAPKPPSPAVPPKPARVESKRIAHLPPSGSLHSRSPSANGRKPLVNQAFLNDLHQAMNQKRNKFPLETEQSSQDPRPFPNRFSSGEYENVQDQQKAPPLPKRNDQTHLTWDRT